MVTAASAGTTQAAALTAKRGRFSVNLAANLGYLALRLVVGVWYVPFLVRRLGPAAYGLIPLASTLTSYMSSLTQGLNSAVGRSFTIAMEQEDLSQANRIFNTSFWGSLTLCTALLIPTVLGLVFLESIVRIPAGFATEARWLFAGIAAAFLLNEIKMPFEVSWFCRNRFDLRNLISMGEILTRVGLVALLFAALSARVHYVGGAILCGTMVSAVGSFWLWRRLTPMLRIQIRDFNWGVLKSLGSMAIWVIVNQLGAFLYLGIDLLVANRLFGTELGGKYAAVLALPLLIQTLGATMAMVFNPTGVFYYARNDIDGLVTHLRRAIKCLGLLLALPIALMCGFSEPLLRLWLGPAFGEMSPLLFLMAVHLCVNMAINPLLGLQITTNRMKVPAVLTLILGVANLGLALLLAGPMHWGLYGIAGAVAITMTLKHAVFTPLYAAHVLGKPSLTFLRGLPPILLVTAAMILLGRAVFWAFAISGWGDLIVIGLGLSALYCAGVYGLILSPAERQMVNKVFRRDRERMTMAEPVEEARTDQQWWEEKTYFNSEPSPDARDRRWFERHLPKRSDWSAIEIGACPGDSLLTLACSHGYHPVALDFLPAVQRLPAAFRKYGVEDLEVIQGDFLSLPEDRRFNVVMSFGFIEHFNNAETVLRKHWALVEEDGYLIITLPIFGPMQLALQRLVLTPDKLAEQLQGHNTSIMDMRLLREWSERLPGAEILECGYMDYMGTWLFSSDPFVRRNRRWILWAWKIASVVPRALHISCRLFSPYGLLFLRRQSEAGNGADAPQRKQLVECR